MLLEKAQELRSAVFAEDEMVVNERSLEVLYPAVIMEDAPYPVVRLTDDIDGDGAPDTFNLAQRFISNYRRRAEGFKRDVLDLMARQGSAFVKEQHAVIRAQQNERHSLVDSMQAIVEHSFDAIEPYAMELNNTLGVAELYISCTHPAWVTEDVGRHTASQRKKYYRARISTTRLSIVIRGGSESVEFFLIPAASVMGLSKIEDQHTPLMRFIATACGAFIDWEVEGKPLTRERLQKYCILLFDHLLKQTREELRTELYARPRAV